MQFRLKLVFCFGNSEQCVVAASMFASDAVWGIGYSKWFGVGPFYVFPFVIEGRGNRTSIELGVIVNYMAGRYVE